MKKAIVFSLVALMTLAAGSTAAYASTAPTPQWGYSYDTGTYESFDSVVQTPDGGYVGVGNQSLIKTDASGTVQWAAQSTFYLKCVKNLPNGGFVVAGYMGNNAYLAKYDANGGLVWVQQYTKGYRLQANTVQLTTDGGFIVSGNSDAIADWNSTDMWLMKTDSNGNKMWERTYGGVKAESAGESDNALQQTSDGGYILVGQSWSYTQTANNSDVYLVKTDANGNLKWSKSYGGAKTDFGNSVQKTTDGGYIIAGRYEYSTDSDAYLIKTDSLGNSQWQRTYGGALSDNANSVYQTSDGGYALSGMYSFSSTDYDFYIVKTTSTGLIDWQNAYGGSLGENSFTMKPTSDGGYVLGGFNESFANTGRDYYLLKLGYGTALSLNGTGGPSNVQVKAIPAAKGKKELAAPFVK